MQHILPLSHFLPERVGERVGDVGLIVDNQDAETHQIAQSRSRLVGDAGEAASQMIRPSTGVPPPVFDLEDPDVRISPTLAGDISIGVGLGDWSRAGCPHPDELAVLSARLRQHRAAGGAPVELEQDRAGISIPAGQDGDRDRGKIAAPNQRLDPDPRFQPSFHPDDK
jgi:hypothetical protein